MTGHMHEWKPMVYMAGDESMGFGCQCGAFVSNHHAAGMLRAYEKLKVDAAPFAAQIEQRKTYTVTDHEAGTFTVGPRAQKG